MTIKRIDSNSIRCFITSEEMESQGIGVDDLMESGKKAETLLRYILQEAREKLDFNAKGEALSVQLTIMPNGDVSLMICNNEKNAVKNMLEQFRDSLQAFKDILEEAKRSVPADPKKVLIPKENGKNENEIIKLPIWAEFKSLDDMIRFVKACPELLNLESTLYKHGETYYLRMFMERTRGEVARTAFKTSEYALVLYSDRPDTENIIEHGKTIIKENAVNILSEL